MKQIAIFLMALAVALPAAAGGFRSKVQKIAEPHIG